MSSSTIVVLGGPAAGKTIFLSALYRHLWEGFDGFTMRSGTGSMHSELVATAKKIEAGDFPAATQALRYFEFELTHFAQTYYLRFLDYPGELFRKVFYDGAVDSDEARELYDLSTTADGVIALADPKSILDGTWDIDYALSNLIRFYRSQDRKQPKFVLAFTKRDETETLVGTRVAAFVNSRLPRLAKELAHGMRLQHFCSILNVNRRVTFAHPHTVIAPLRSVIDALEGEQKQRDRERHLRHVKWRRAAARSLVVLLAMVLILVAFTSGIVCREKSGKRLDADAISLSNE